MDEGQRLFRANPKLKREGSVTKFTPEQVKEFKLCMDDPIHFAEGHMKIISLDRGLETIKLYDHQKMILRGLSENRHNIVLSSRQTGKCVSGETLVRVRDKETQEEKEITIGEFFRSLD
jgi:hypothetical protein